MNKHFGKCSICGKETYLSADHIPPKSCGNNGDSYYIQYVPEYLGNGANMKPKHSQNGIKFYFICDKCNNDMGAKYDNDLKEFRDCIISLINNQKPTNQFEIRNVCKSIIGHFLAASSFDACTFAKAMRSFYLEDDPLVLEKFSLFCIYYPYQNRIFSLNDYVPLQLGDSQIPEGMLSSLYFYPFAFIFCDKQKLNIGTDLFEMCRTKMYMLRIRSDDWGTKHPTWPAIVDNNHAFVLSGAAKDSVFKIK